MQSRSSSFDNYAKGQVRPLSWDFYASFDKNFNSDVEFFTLDGSVLNGPDLLASEDSNVIQEWDKYSYKNYTDRIMQMEWQREESVPYSVNLAIADITLRNNDNFFTYGAVAKMESLFDNFRLGIDKDKWERWGGSNVQPVSGRIEITGGPGVGYYGINSLYGFDMTGSYISCQLVDAGDQILSNYEAIPIELTNLIDPNDTMKISVENGTVYCFKVVNTVPTNQNSLAYDDAVHKFFRIRESAGTTYWEFSTDGVSWTTMHSEANPFEVTILEYQMVVGFFAVDLNETTAIFDNVNCFANGERSGSQVISPISSYNLPRRPVRLFSGFDGENLPQFVGLTDKPPIIDRIERTASLHAEDFLTYLFDKPLDEAVIYTNIKTDAALNNLFELAGLLPSQYVLDEAFNEIAFLFFDKGTKLGSAVRKLMQAELGSLYMDEVGMIRFKNRFKISGSPVYNFNSSNIIDYETGDVDTVINVVEIKSEVREVQPLQVIYNIAEPIEIGVGETLSVFFNFEDPVTSIDVIDSYQAFANEDSTGSDVTADVNVTATSLFATSVKVTFENTGSVNAYITKLNILGTPARVVKNIYLRSEDAESIEKFEEQPIEIDNDFIQSDNAASSIALSLINYYKTYTNTITLEVKGNQALQLNDNIQVDVDNISQEYKIQKITSVMDSSYNFRQTIEARVYNIPDFFILDESVLNGEDVLAF